MHGRILDGTIPDDKATLALVTDGITGRILNDHIAHSHVALNITVLYT